MTVMSQIANRIVGRSSPLTLLGPIGSSARFAKICYLLASRSWTSECQQEYHTCTCNAIATYWRKFLVPTVHKFALPLFVPMVRCVSLRAKSKFSENPARDMCVRAPLRDDSRFSATCGCIGAVSIRRKFGLLVQCSLQACQGLCCPVPSECPQLVASATVSVNSAPPAQLAVGLDRSRASSPARLCAAATAVRQRRV